MYAGAAIECTSKWEVGQYSACPGTAQSTEARDFCQYHFPTGVYLLYLPRS